MVRVERRASISVIVGLAIAVSACGGSRGNAASSTATSEASVESSGSSSSSRGRARQGAHCDFGGAADSTCMAGLSCCYGPPEDPGEWGTCLPECP